MLYVFAAEYLKLCVCDGFNQTEAIGFNILFTNLPDYAFLKLRPNISFQCKSFLSMEENSQELHNSELQTTLTIQI